MKPKKFSNNKLNKPYMVHTPPFFDPCIECLVRVPCNEPCNDKISFEKYINISSDTPTIVVKISNMRKGKKL